MALFPGSKVEVGVLNAEPDHAVRYVMEPLTYASWYAALVGRDSA